MGTISTLAEKTVTEPALNPQTLTGNVNGVSVNREGFNEVLFVFNFGDVNADTSYTVTLEESLLTGSGFTAVAGFSQAVVEDDNTRFEFYVDARPRKKFLRLVFTGSSTAALASAIAVKLHGHSLPQS